MNKIQYRCGICGHEIIKISNIFKNGRKCVKCKDGTYDFVTIINEDSYVEYKDNLDENMKIIVNEIKQIKKRLSILEFKIG